jgi:hypothetical protein
VGLSSTTYLQPTLSLVETSLVPLSRPRNERVGRSVKSKEISGQVRVNLSELHQLMMPYKRHQHKKWENKRLSIEIRLVFGNSMVFIVSQCIPGSRSSASSEPRRDGVCFPALEQHPFSSPLHGMIK